MLFKFQKEQLLKQLNSGKISRLNSIALDYFSTSLLKNSTLPKERIIKLWTGGKPNLYDICQTQWGNIGILLIPMSESDLYEKSDGLVKHIINSMKIAESLGVKSVSLTGLMPSAVNYGKKVIKELEIRGENKLPKLSTGHETTCSVMILNIKNILEKAGRNIKNEVMAFIGVGSIGLSTLRLLLSSQEHPKGIVLCDLSNRKDELKTAKLEIKKEYRFKGDIEIYTTNLDVPDAVYKKSKFIIGATNIPDVVNVDKLAPGTLIVDDSGPHCFSFKAARLRFEEKQDILFTEGGVMKTPKPVIDMLHIPSKVERYISKKSVEQSFIKALPNEIASCVMAGLFTEIFNLEPTIGFVKNNVALEYLSKIESLGIKGSSLHCQDYILDEKIVGKFKKRYGTIDK